jgi:tetratricopeptide (TPR) repeat protein
MALGPLLWLIEWGRGDRIGLRRILNKIPYLLLGLAAAILTIVAQSGAIYREETAAVVNNLVLAARSFWFYMGKLLWPVHLSAIYPYPAEVDPTSPGYLAASAAFLLFFGLAVAVARRCRAWSAAWGFFLVAWLPFSGLVVYGTHFAADRYLYLPALGPFLLVGLGLERLLQATRSRKPAWLHGAVVVGCAVLVGSLVGTTASRCRVWRGGETLFRDVIERYPDCVFALNNLGVALANQGRYAEAIPHYRRAVAVDPDESVSWANLGVALQAEGRLDEAMDANRTALALDPVDAVAWNNIGSIHMERRDWAEALEAFGEAILIDPGYQLARDNIRRVHLALQARTRDP